jgi:hypothetical protein
MNRHHQHRKLNLRQAERIEALVVGYSSEPDGNRATREDLVDALTDLCHLAEHRGFLWPDLLRSAWTHYTAEGGAGHAVDDLAAARPPAPGVSWEESDRLLCDECGNEVTCQGADHYYCVGCTRTWVREDDGDIGRPLHDPDELGSNSNS